MSDNINTIYRDRLMTKDAAKCTDIHINKLLLCLYQFEVIHTKKNMQINTINIAF